MFLPTPMCEKYYLLSGIQTHDLRHSRTDVLPLDHRVSLVMPVRILSLAAGTTTKIDVIIAMGINIIILVLMSCEFLSKEHLNM